MPDKLSVGIIIPNDFVKRLPFGGGSGFIQNIINVVTYNVVIFGSGANGSELWQEIHLNEKTIFQATYPIRYPSSLPLRIYALFGYISNRNRILDSDVDLLYIHSPECALPFLFGRKRKPVVFHQHGSGNPVSTATYPWARNSLFRWIFDTIHKIIYRRSDWIIVIDRLCQNQATKYGCRRKSSLLMNAVDSSQFYPNEKVRTRMRSTYNLSENETVILFVGRLEELKQVDRVIQSLSFLDSAVKARLLIAGTGSQRVALEELAVQAGVADKVIFLEKIPHNELPLYYNMADLLALPSKMEGVPMVILEALSCGKPVLATAVGGIPDLITSGTNGMLIPEASASQIAKSIESISKRSWDTDTICNSVSTWRSEAVAEALLSIFGNLLKKQ